MRKAEQRCPAESKADDRTSTTTCSASAEESTTIALRPPVSAISGSGRARAREAPGELFFDQPRDRRRAGEDDALDARIGDQRRADFARARHELQRVARNARFMQHAHGLGGDERRLFGGLGDHGIARGERRGDLAGEDRERKVPGLMQTTRPSGAGSRVRACAPPRARSSAGSRRLRALPRRRWRRTCRPRAR